jgi:6-phosphogluconolactonase
MADHSIKNLGIGLASSLLAGAISVAAATGAGASTGLTGGAAHSYVYTESNQSSAAGGNSVLAYSVDSGGTLTAVGSFATGGDGTGAGLGSQGAVTLSDGGHALLVVNAGSNTVSYLRILSNGSLWLVDAAPSGGADPVSVTASGRRVEVLNQGSNTVAGLLLTSGSSCRFEPRSPTGLRRRTPQHPTGRWTPRLGRSRRIEHQSTCRPRRNSPIRLAGQA